MLDLELNGTGAPHGSADLDVHESPRSGTALDALAVANLPFAEGLYFKFLQDPASVDPEWRRLFVALAELEGAVGLNGGGATALVPPESFPRSIFAGRQRGAQEDAPSAPGAIQSRTSVRLLAERVQRLVEAYRELGHLAVDLDPLGLVKRPGPSGPSALRARGRGPRSGVQQRERARPGWTTLRDLIEFLGETYCRKLGVRARPPQRDGAARLAADADGDHAQPAAADPGRSDAPSQQVIGAEVFEQFLQNKFIGAKRFSLEGAESLIPLLERLIERAARSNVAEIVIGMAHRGRLNVLANVLGKPASQIFAEFQDKLDETADLTRRRRRQISPRLLHRSRVRRGRRRA